MKYWLAIVLATVAVNIHAESETDDWVAQWGHALQEARAGTYTADDDVWLRLWELPTDVQLRFVSPSINLRNANGETPYVLVGGNRRIEGDMLGDYLILVIEDNGVVLEVEGYAVLIE